MDKLCQATTKDGKPCSAPAQAGKKYCFMHDPDNAEKAREARKRGNETTNHRNKLKKVGAGNIGLPRERYRLNSLKDVKKLLADTTNAYIQGAINVEQAKCIAYLASTMTSNIKDADLEKALKNLEERINNQYTSNSANNITQVAGY